MKLHITIALLILLSRADPSVGSADVSHGSGSASGDLSDLPPVNEVVEMPRDFSLPPREPYTIFNINLRVNGLNSDGACDENDFNWIMHGCLERDYILGLQSAMVYCGHELPYRSAEFKRFHALLWTCSRPPCDRMLELLYGEERCQNYSLLKALASDVLTAHPDDAKLYLPRLERLKKHCPDADSVTLAGIIAKIPEKRVGARRLFQNWKRQLDALLPPWPYQNFFKSHIQRRTLHMASLAVNAAINCNRFVVPSLPPWGQAIGSSRRMRLSNTAAGITDARVSPRWVDILETPRRTLEARMPPHSSYGSYRLQGAALQVLTRGEIGVWIVSLVEGGEMMKEVVTICDSLWGSDNCNSDRHPLPTDSTTSVVVIMGPRSIFSDADKLNTLKPVLMASDVEGFQSDMNHWFKSFACSPEGERPAFLTSMFFRH